MTGMPLVGTQLVAARMCTLVLMAVATANHEYMPSGPHAPIVVAIRTLNSTKSVMGFSKLLQDASSSQAAVVTSADRQPHATGVRWHRPEHIR